MKLLLSLIIFITTSTVFAKTLEMTCTGPYQEVYKFEISKAGIQQTEPMLRGQKSPLFPFADQWQRNPLGDILAKDLGIQPNEIVSDYTLTKEEHYGGHFFSMVQKQRIEAAGDFQLIYQEISTIYDDSAEGSYTGTYSSFQKLGEEKRTPLAFATCVGKSLE